MRRVGLVVNPVAGLGGPVGLNGTDGADLQRLAVARGARPRAGQRAALAVRQLLDRRPGVRVLTAAGDMGEASARSAGAECAVLSGRPALTSRQDTRRVVAELVSAGVELLLFAGGDGTARDVLDAVGGPGPAVLGIPAGVKMHSAVYAANPRAAGEVADAFLAGRAELAEAEVLDRDERELRSSRIGARLYGYLAVPSVPVKVPQGKVGSSLVNTHDLAGIAQDLAEQLRAEPDTVFLVGPGTTTRAVLSRFGVELNPVGVAAVDARGTVAVDADADLLHKIVANRPATVVVSPIGGQGFLFGRGNQQLAPAVLRTVGRERIRVVCTEAKLSGLHGQPLLVDTGDDEVDALLRGYLPVITGYLRRTIYRVS